MKQIGAMKYTLKLPSGVHGQSVRRPGLDAILSQYKDQWWWLYENRFEYDEQERDNLRDTKWLNNYVFLCVQIYKEVHL